MSGDTAIADVGATILKLLRDQLSDMVPAGSIGMHSPADVSGPNTRLTLFLYHIAENQYLRNQEAGQLAGGSIRQPPLVTDLYYMLTAYSTVQDLTERSLEEHRILGRAMRVLYDHSTLGGSALQGGLAESGERPRITLHPASVSDLSEIWNAFPNHNFRPSVCYVISPVAIESARVAQPKRVSVRELNYSSVEAGR